MKYEKLTKKDFDWINWTPGQIKKLPAQIKAERQKRIDAILAVPKEERTFENTVWAFDQIQAHSMRINGCLYDHFMLNTKASVRNAAKNAMDQMDEDSRAQMRNPRLLTALLEFKKNNKKKLNTEDKKLLDDSVRGLKRLGFTLSEDKQKKLSELNKKLSETVSSFWLELNSYEDSIRVSKKQTKGLPDSYLESLKKDKEGNYIVGLSYPEYRPFMQFAENEAKRKELRVKEYKRGGRKCLNLLKKAVKIRAEIAAVHGYKNYADFVLEEKMAKNLKNVRSFLDDLEKKVSDQARKEISLLKKEKKKHLGKKAKEFGPHDISFYSQKLKADKFQLDDNEIKKYFPTEFTVNEILNFFSEMYGFTWKENKKIKTWHQGVRTIEVHQKENLIGYIWLDLYPRAGKYGHACSIPMSRSSIDPQKNQRTVSLNTLVMNFSKGSKKEPAQMTLLEVLYFLHELGHGLHQTLSTAKYLTQSGTAVFTDFVETPSQMQENFLYEGEVLKKISRHIDTGETIPDELIKSIQVSEEFMNALATAQYLISANLDLTMHVEQPDSPEKVYAKSVKKAMGIDIPKSSVYPASFQHMANPMYTVGYYQYRWAQVYADDIFSVFKKEGVTNKRVGKRYVKEILSRGSSRDELESVKAFLGRKPNNKAFLKKLGIK